eukprot:CCRYP_011806-RC/>CCRYP_011806-RC protein AED:0.36 eAED:1.00 QI:0/-1/0/1/-1/0/1/0/162
MSAASPMAWENGLQRSFSPSPKHKNPFFKTPLSSRESWTTSACYLAMLCFSQAMRHRCIPTSKHRQHSRKSLASSKNFLMTALLGITTPSPSSRPSTWFLKTIFSNSETPTGAKSRARVWVSPQPLRGPLSSMVFLKSTSSKNGSSTCFYSRDSLTISLASG